MELLQGMQLWYTSENPGNMQYRENRGILATHHLEKDVQN